MFSILLFLPIFHHPGGGGGREQRLLKTITDDKPHCLCLWSLPEEAPRRLHGQLGSSLPRPSRKHRVPRRWMPKNECASRGITHFHPLSNRQSQGGGASASSSHDSTDFSRQRRRASTSTNTSTSHTPCRGACRPCGMALPTSHQAEDDALHGSGKLHMPSA